jgi:hypothetical protein
MLRGGIYAILAVVALAFALAAIGTDIAHYGVANPDGNTYDNKASLWYLCQSGGPAGSNSANSATSCFPADEIGCTGLKDRFRTSQAFYIMTAVILLVALVFAVLDHGNVHGFKHYKVLLLLFALATIVFSVIGWAVAISIARETFCEGDVNTRVGPFKDQPNFEWRASPFLLLVSTVFGIAMLVVALRAPHGATEHVHPDRVRAEPTHA